MTRAVIALLLAPFLIAGCAASREEGSVLQGTVSDAANGMPVHDARVFFGGRTTTLHTTRTYRLSHLSAHEGVLTVEAEGYEAFQEPVRLHGQMTDFNVALTGKVVPGLAGILVWCEWEPEALRVDIRLTDMAGVTLRTFPALAFTGEARLSVNAGTERSPRPAALLFQGPVTVTYDPDASLDRLKARIPRHSIARVPAGAASGVLSFTLKSPQGDFTWVRGDVPLREGK